MVVVRKRQPNRRYPVGMNVETLEELKQLLADLQPHVKHMTGRSPGFVTDTADRVSKYGAETFMSPKQWQWLRDLHSEFVGTEAKREDEPRGADGRRGDDDEIPF